MPKKVTEPVIVPRAAHGISRSLISKNALKVLYRLHEAGYSAYLVGGCVRDILLQKKPKDFDIVTNAHPEEIRKLFKNCRLIGRRFRLAHILFGPDVIEVATFRTHHENADTLHHAKSVKGMIIRDNVYGTIEDDAWRRDFRINALYYNIADFSIVDYTGGMKDVEEKTLHMIGDPEQRFQEDPVRLLRAVRFQARCNLQVSPDTEGYLYRLGYLLTHVSSGRLFQEVLKFFQGGESLTTTTLLRKYQFFGKLFPATDPYLEKIETLNLINAALKNTDHRVSEGKSVSPAFIFAVFLWYPVITTAEGHMAADGIPLYLAFEKAMQVSLKEQAAILAMPRVMQVAVRDICFLQHRFLQRRGAQPFRLLQHPRFKAAFDLLLLRKDVETNTTELATWWIEFHEGTVEKREQLMKTVNKKTLPTRKKRRLKSTK